MHNYTRSVEVGDIIKRISYFLALLNASDIAAKCEAFHANNSALNFS